MTKEEFEKIREKIENSALSQCAKWCLRQFLAPIRCGCGHTVVHAGKMSLIRPPMGMVKNVKEINDSGIATATAELAKTYPAENLFHYHLAVQFR